jgi:hypothetical protein
MKTMLLEEWKIRQGCEKERVEKRRWEGRRSKRLPKQWQERNVRPRQLSTTELQQKETSIPSSAVFLLNV